jgi:hypothetical protein
MSLSFTRYADFNPTPIAHVVDENKPKANVMLYMYDRKVPDGVPSIELPEHQSLEACVDDNGGAERQCIYISGMSGAGKSYTCKQFIERYHKLYPRRDVFVFSSLDSCATLDKLKYLKRIKIKAPAFLERELTALDFKDSLVLFDDCDVIDDKRLRTRVHAIMNSILQIGRHHRVSCLVTSHACTNGKDTKIILNEAHNIVLFPKCSGNKSLNYISDSYIGLNTKQTKAMKQVEGRFINVVRKHPRCMFSLKAANMLNTA